MIISHSIHRCSDIILEWLCCNLFVNFEKVVCYLSACTCLTSLLESWFGRRLSIRENSLRLVMWLPCLILALAVDDLDLVSVSNFRWFRRHAQGDIYILNRKDRVRSLWNVKAWEEKYDRFSWCNFDRAATPFYYYYYSFIMFSPPSGLSCTRGLWHTGPFRWKWQQVQYAEWLRTTPTSFKWARG